MTLDQVLLVALVAAAAWGAITGALVQLGRLVAAVAGWAGARWLAPELVPSLRTRLPAFAAAPTATVLAFVGCGLAAGVLVKVLLLGTRVRHLSGSGADRGLGALFGGAKAAVGLWVVVSAIAAWGRPIHLGPVNIDPSRSDAVALVREAGSPRRRTEPPRATGGVGTPRRR